MRLANVWWRCVALYVGRLVSSVGELWHAWCVPSGATLWRKVGTKMSNDKSKLMTLDYVIGRFIDAAAEIADDYDSDALVSWASGNDYENVDRRIWEEVEAIAPVATADWFSLAAEYPAFAIKGDETTLRDIRGAFWGFGVAEVSDRLRDLGEES